MSPVYFLLFLTGYEAGQDLVVGCYVERREKELLVIV